MTKYSDGIAHALGLIEAGDCKQATLVVHDFDDFRELAVESYAEIGAQGAAIAIHHERQHVSAAAQIGLRVVRYATAFHAPQVDASWGSGIGVQTFITVAFDDRNFTNLEKAAVVGHPSILSQGDLAAMAELGYDLDSLREEAEFANSDGANIPVPLSGVSEPVAF